MKTKGVQVLVDRDVLDELEDLRRKVARAEKKKKTNFNGTVFHHFKDVATIGARLWADSLSSYHVGVALLALPQYRYPDNTIIHPDVLALAGREGQIKDCRPGDKYNSALGRIIAHGRSITCRNYCSFVPVGTFVVAIEELREFERSIPKAHYPRDPFDPETLSYVTHLYELQNMVKDYFVEETD